jgi:hypothetical protein
VSAKKKVAYGRFGEKHTGGKGRTKDVESCSEDWKEVSRELICRVSRYREVAIDVQRKGGRGKGGEPTPTMTGLERVYQVRLVDDRSARGVDDEHILCPDRMASISFLATRRCTRTEEGR